MPVLAHVGNGLVVHVFGHAELFDVALGFVIRHSLDVVLSVAGLDFAVNSIVALGTLYLDHHMVLDLAHTERDSLHHSSGPYDCVRKLRAAKELAVGCHTSWKMIR